MGTEHLTGRKCIMAATSPPQVPGVIHNNHATEFQRKQTIPQLQVTNFFTPQFDHF